MAWAAVAIGLPRLAAAELYGISKPSAEVALGFTTPGRVVTVRVVDGVPVKAGEVIAEQDVSVLDARIKQVRLEAESSVEVGASQAELAQRRQELKKIGQAHEKGAATDLELERAELEVAISEFRLKAAEEKRQMAAYRLEELQAERNLLLLKSPVDGVIEKLQVEVGEAPQTMEPVVWVVNCDPLWIDAPLPLRAAESLSPGDAIQLVFPDGSGGVGTVTNIARVADAASETVATRIDMANPQGRRAGERVRIVFSERPSAGAAARE